MDDFYLFLDEKYIYIIALKSERYLYRLYDFPDYVKEHMNKLQFFKSLDSLQVSLVEQITYNEFFRLHLNENIEQFINYEIHRQKNT